MTSIGIDFGTINSCVEVFRDNGIEIVTNEMGNRMTPSIVAFTDEGILIGDSAKQQIKQNPTNTIYNIKRFLGRTFDDPYIQNYITKYPFKIISDGKNMIQIEVQLKGETKHFYPEEITAMLLTKLKKDAENYLNEKVTEAVISIPAYFNNRQRQAMINAAQIADLTILQLLNDPTAISYAITLTEKFEGEQKMLIVDIGGGTFDSSIISYEEGMIEVSTTSGDTSLGGEDFNEELFQYAIKFLNEKHPELKVESSAENMRNILDLCEKAKLALSNEIVTEIDLSSLFDKNDIKIEISRTLFDDLNEKNYEKITEKIKKVFDDNENISFDDINLVFLIGGSSQIPGIKKLIQNFFNCKKPSTIYINPEEVVAYGAAFYAATIKGEKSYGMDMTLTLDILPISIGTQKESEIFIPYFPRNITIPALKSHTFSTFYENQTEIEVFFFEGERMRSKDNDLFDIIVVSHIPQAKRQEPQIEITFSLDNNAILSASVQGKLSGVPIEGLALCHKRRCFLADEEIAILKDKFKDLDIL